MEIERQKQQHFKAVLRANRYIYGNFGDEGGSDTKRPSIWTSQQKVGRNGLSFGNNIRLANGVGAATNTNQLNDFLSFYQTVIYFCDEDGYYYANRAIERIKWLFNIQVVGRANGIGPGAPAPVNPIPAAPVALMALPPVPNGAGVNTRILAFINAIRNQNLVTSNPTYVNAVAIVRTLCQGPAGKLVNRATLHDAYNAAGVVFTPAETDALRTISTLMILSDHSPVGCPPSIPQKWAYKLVSFRN